MEQKKTDQDVSEETEILSANQSSGKEPSAEQPNSLGPAQSLMTALNKKYSTSSIGTIHCEIFLTAGAPRKTVSGTLVIPPSLSLDCQNISRVGNVQVIGEACSKVTDLDLAGNQLSCWQEIFGLLGALPRLQFLNLSANPLEALTGRADVTPHCGLRKLVLNATNVSWATVTHLLEVFPSLEELYLSRNSLTTCAGLEYGQYPSLTFLQLTSNNFSDWTDICQLGRTFCNLQLLILAYNPIDSLGSWPVACAAFPAVTTLNLNHTRISAWNELGKLSHLPQLYDVRLLEIPLIQDIQEDILRRQLLIGTLANVKCINGGKLAPDERDTAERAYLRHFENQSEKPERYEELLLKHGTLPALAEVTMDAGPKHITVKVIVENQSINTELRVSLDDTVESLKRSLCSVAGVSPPSSKALRVFLEFPSEPVSYLNPMELRQNSARLRRLNIGKDSVLRLHVKESNPRRSSAKNVSRSSSKTSTSGDK